MLSSDLLFFILALAAIICMVISQWRGQTTLDHLSRATQRFAERNDAARDRLHQSVIEKLSVLGDSQATVRLALQHGQEAASNAVRARQHDAAVESLDDAAARREARRAQRHYEKQTAAAGSPQDAMG